MLMFFLILSSIAYSGNLKWEKLIVLNILISMSKEAKTTVYTSSNTLKKILCNTDVLKFVQNCEKADFVLSSENENKKCKKPELVFKYTNYIKNPYAVAVFFWQKGRPTIRFSKQRLKKFGIKIHGELSKFESEK